MKAAIGLLAIFVAWMVYERLHSGSTVTVRDGVRAAPFSEREPEKPSDELPAGAGCNVTDVWVDNKGADIWTDARIEVNGTYEYSPGAVMGGGRQPYSAHLFTKSDGTRLNLALIACKAIDIHATVNGKRAHWNGAYR